MHACSRSAVHQLATGAANTNLNTNSVHADSPNQTCMPACRHLGTHDECNAVASIMKSTTKQEYIQIRYSRSRHCSGRNCGILKKPLTAIACMQAAAPNQNKKTNKRKQQQHLNQFFLLLPCKHT